MRRTAGARGACGGDASGHDGVRQVDELDESEDEPGEG